MSTSASEAPPAQPPVRRLTRSRDNRVVAGVCAGLSRYTRVDPVVFRVVLGVLVVFGGLGALLYLLGWILMPEEGETASPVEALVGRGRSTTSPTVTVLLILASVLLVDLVLRDDFRNLVLLGLSVLGLVMLLRREGWTPPATSPPPGPAEPEQAPYAPHGPYAPSDITSTTATIRLDKPPAGDGDGEGPTAPLPPLPPRRERSKAGVIALCAALIVIGLLAAARRVLSWDIPAAGILAAGLALLGVGLLAGARGRRTRGLIPLGIVIAIVLPIVTAVDGNGRYLAKIGDRELHPTTVAGIDRDYRIGIGDIRLDLTDVPFDNGTRVETHLRTVTGDLRVSLPPNVDVVVHAKTRAGDMDLFEDRFTGTGIDRTRVNYGDDGPGGGHLDLWLNATVGDLRVVR
ncbi:MAG: PspC domain-containing protein [Mycobacteriales bacterium]